MSTTYLHPRQWETWRCRSGRRSKLLWVAWSWFSWWSWHWPRASRGTWPRGSVRQRRHTITAARLLSSLHQTPLQAQRSIHMICIHRAAFIQAFQTNFFRTFRGNKGAFPGHVHCKNHIFLYNPLNKTKTDISPKVRWLRLNTIFKSTVKISQMRSNLNVF